MIEQKKATPASHERKADLDQLGEIARDQREAIRDHLERGEQKQPQDNEHEALTQASKLAKEAEKLSKKKPEGIEHHHRGAPTKAQLRSSFKSQMKDVQSEMNAGDKLVSKFIHIPIVESIADRAGSTIARPNALLSGSIAAFIGVTLSYFIAKHYGYQLSGFETIGAFIVGWVIGILYDYFSVIFRRKRDR